MHASLKIRGLTAGLISVSVNVDIDQLIAYLFILPFLAQLAKLFI